MTLRFGALIGRTSSSASRVWVRGSGLSFRIYGLVSRLGLTV